MATLQLTSESVNVNGTNEETFVDMETIRRRLATIKNRWTPETVKARAIEGARRRAELEAIVGLDFADSSQSEDHGFGLVG